jgi:hypothetical protein
MGFNPYISEAAKEFLKPAVAKAKQIKRNIFKTQKPSKGEKLKKSVKESSRVEPTEIGTATVAVKVGPPRVVDIKKANTAEQEAPKEQDGPESQTNNADQPEIPVIVVTDIDAGPAEPAQTQENGTTRSSAAQLSGVVSSASTDPSTPAVRRSTARLIPLAEASNDKDGLPHRNYSSARASSNQLSKPSDKPSLPERNDAWTETSNSQLWRPTLLISPITTVIDIDPADLVVPALPAETAEPAEDSTATEENDGNRDLHECPLARAERSLPIRNDM